jgi:hypothetical protein
MNPEASASAGTSSDGDPTVPALHPSIVLSAYLEPLVRGRRVAILGDATLGLADELGERGARLVHVYDPDAARVAEALARSAPGRAHQVAHAVLAGDLGVRDGAFDVVIVPDLSLFADPADAIRRARRLVPASGVAAFVTPNTGGAAQRLVPGGSDAEPAGKLGYYELFDLVSLQFAKVRMIGQAPFVGYTVADFAPNGDPEVSVDTSLLVSSEEPEHFIAVGSDRVIPLEDYAVVELPWSDVSAALARRPARAAAELARAQVEADAAGVRAAALGAEVAALREREASLIVLVSEAEARTSIAATRAAELEVAVESREARLHEIEARAGDNHVRAERLTNQIRDLEEELRRQRDRGTKLHKLLDDEKKARTKAELELGIFRGNPQIPGAKDRIDALAAELDAARAQLAHLVHLEADLAEARRRLAEPPPPAPPPPPDAKMLERIDELEQAVDISLRDAAEAAAQRDAALDRARKAEARLARADEVARRLTEAERLATEREKRIAEQDARLAAVQVAHEAALEAALEAARQSAAPARDDGPELTALADEIASLEAALRERGQVIAGLHRDLREGERVGKELLGELEALRPWTGNGVSQASGGWAQDDDLRGRLDALASGAARSEADLQAATWRIAQLERELGEARRTSVEPTPVQAELEQALAAARDEVASLRRALAGAAS